MLDAHPHREGLLLHGEPCITNELERVACRVAACQDKRGARLKRLFAGLNSAQHDRGEPAVFELNLDKLRMKTHFAAKADDVFANGGYDARKIIASHVRMRLP